MIIDTKHAWLKLELTQDDETQTLDALSKRHVNKRIRIGKWSYEYTLNDILRDKHAVDRIGRLLPDDSKHTCPCCKHVAHDIF